MDDFDGLYVTASRHHPPQDVKIITDFAEGCSKSRGHLAAFSNSTVSAQAGSFAHNAKARRGEPKRALEEDKGWDPHLLFHGGCGPGSIYKKNRDLSDHKRAYRHHNQFTVQAAI